eukprot:3125730-Amphidinium_carterae.1
MEVSRLSRTPCTNGNEEEALPVVLIVIVVIVSTFCFSRTVFQRSSSAAVTYSSAIAMPFLPLSLCAVSVVCFQ